MTDYAVGAVINAGDIMTAPIEYIPNFVPEPDLKLKALQEGLDWERRGDAPRCEYYCNDFDEPYVYGRGNGQRTYLVRPYTAEILEIRKSLEDYAGCKFEVCFLNRYLNQRDHLGWHADDSPEMDDARPIASISLGVEREIWFRPKASMYGNVEVEKIKLGNGSLCLMKAGMQKTHLHRIPKAGFLCGERISLTFRGYVSA
jgi:alkylated DNA repair dioxygenase AlkB